MVGVVLQDEAVCLRPVTLEDVDPWLAGQDEEQIRWFEFPRPAQRADVLEAVQRWQESWRQGGPVRHWAIVDRRSGELAGGVEVRDLGAGEVNLSYLVFPAFRRRGLATRASRLVLAYAHREMRAATAVVKVLDGNVASVAVAHGVGAVEVGRAPSEAGGVHIIFRVLLDTPSSQAR